jgi:hypothetical protein
MLRSHAFLAQLRERDTLTTRLEMTNRDAVAAARLIVGARFPAYLVAMIEGSAMPDSVAAPRQRLSRALLATAAGFAVLLAGTIVLWAHYGTAVFYEMILAGIAACF